MNYKEERNSKFLAYFWDLASNDDKCRISACVNIVKFLKETSDSETHKSDVEYAVKRLLKGLSSSRQSARQGFATCLCEVLRSFAPYHKDLISVGPLLDTLDKDTKITSSIKGAEERDCIFAKIFGMLAIVRSGLLLQEINATKGNKHFKVSLVNVTRVLSSLCQIYHSKKWVEEVAIESIFEVLYSLAPSSDGVVDLTVIHAMFGTNANSSDNNEFMSLFHQLLRRSSTTDATQEDGNESGSDSDNDGEDSEDFIAGNNPNHLLFLLAMQQFLMHLRMCSQKKGAEQQVEIATTLMSLFPQRRFIALATSADDSHGVQLARMRTMLMKATAHFPKIHSVWDYMLSAVVLGERGSGASGLTKAQEGQLQVWVQWLQNSLLTVSSHEKKSVGLKLIARCILHRAVPAEYMPLIVPRSFIRLLLVSRVNVKHTLHHVAGDVISDLERGVTSQQSKLALASSIIQFGNANFDSYTNTTLLQTLLKGLDEQARLSYVEFLCQMIYDNSVRVAAAPTVAVKDSATAGDNDDDSEDDEEEQSEDVRASSLANIYAALDSLLSVAKGQALAGTDSKAPSLIITLLARLACFSAGQVSLGFAAIGQTQCAQLLQLVEAGSAVLEASAAPLGEKTPKKGKKTPVKAAAPVVRDCVAYAPEVHQKAQKLLVQLLADTGHLAAGPQEGAGSVMDGAMAAITVMLGRREKYPTVSLLCAVAAAAASTDMDVDMDDDEDDSNSGGLSEEQVVETLVAGCDLFAEQQKSPSGAASGLAKAQETLNSLLSQIIIYTLCSASGIVPSEEEKDIEEAEGAPNAALFVEYLEKYCECFKLLMGPKTNGKDKSKTKKAEDDEQSAQNPLLQLLDCCEVFLVSSDDSAGCTIRGVRAQIKRVWQAVWAADVASVSAANRAECLDSVLHMVVGTDLEEEAEEEGEGDSDSDGEDGSDEEDDEAAVSKKMARIAMAVGADAATGEESEEEEEEEGSDDEGEEDDDDQSAGSDDDDSDSDSSEVGVEMKHTNLEHTEEADAALVKMIKLQQQSRKSGIAALRRQQYMARTRLLDVLEAIVHSIVSAKHGSDAEVAGDGALFPLLLPLLLCCRRNVYVPQTGSRKRDTSTAESRAFAARLQALVGQKICKKAISLPAVSAASNMEVENGDDGEGENLTEVGALCGELKRCLVSAHAGLRATAMSILLSCLRSVNVTTLLGGDKASSAQLEAVQSAISSSAAGSSSSSSGANANAMLFMALTKELFVSFVAKKSARHNLSNKLFDTLVSKNSPSLVALMLWDELVSGCVNGKDSFLRGECMRWVGGLLKKQGELAPVLRTHLLAHASKGVGLLLSNLEAVALKLSELTSPTPWKRLKPLCDCTKEVCDYLRKQPTDAVSTPVLPTKSPKKSKVVAPAAPAAAPTAATLVPLVRSIICKLSDHQSQLPGVRSLVMYHNSVIMTAFKLPDSAKIPVAEKPAAVEKKTVTTTAEEEEKGEKKHKHKKHKKEHNNSAE